MQEVKAGLKMYGSLLKMTLRGILQYRVDFWMSLVSVCLLNGANIVQLSVISWRFHALGSWQVGDLLVLYGLFMISWSIFSVFFYKLSKIEDEIVSGAFDVYLLRPVSPFLQLVGGDIKYTGLCDTLLGAVLVPTGLAMSGTHWGLWQILWFVIFVLSGGAIAVCIKFLISCVTFWTTKASALSQVFIQIYLLTQKYPVTIFGPAFRVLVTGFVPVAYLNFYPAVYLLGKPDAPPWLCMLAPVVALLLAGVSVLVWRGGCVGITVAEDEERAYSLLSGANFEVDFRLGVRNSLTPFVLLTHTVTHTRKNCVEIAERIGRKIAGMCAGKV